jgi:hypothetical protein
MPVNFFDPATANTEIQKSKNPNKHTKKIQTQGVFIELQSFFSI